MSMTIEIEETTFNLEIESIISDNINTIEIESSTSETLNINSGYVGTVVFASDVIGLDDYLSNFIDDYEIDCGTP